MNARGRAAPRRRTRCPRLTCRCDRLAPRFRRIIRVTSVGRNRATTAEDAAVVARRRSGRIASAGGMRSARRTADCAGQQPAGCPAKDRGDADRQMVVERRKAEELLQRLIIPEPSYAGRDARQGADCGDRQAPLDVVPSQVATAIRRLSTRRRAATTRPNQRDVEDERRDAEEDQRTKSRTCSWCSSFSSVHAETCSDCGRRRARRMAQRRSTAQSRPAPTPLRQLHERSLKLPSMLNADVSAPAHPEDAEPPLVRKISAGRIATYSAMRRR